MMFLDVQYIFGLEEASFGGAPARRFEELLALGSAWGPGGARFQKSQAQGRLQAGQICQNGFDTQLLKVAVVLPRKYWYNDISQHLEIESS